MKTAAASLFRHLVEDPGVQAFVQDRVYPLGLPQRPQGADLQPSIAFRLAGRRDELTLRKERTLARTIWEVAVLTADYDTAHEVAEAVIASLSYFKGRMGGEDGIWVESCTLQDAVDQEEPSVGVVLVLLEFEIQFV